VASVALPVFFAPLFQQFHVFHTVFKKPAETKKLAPSDPAGFWKNWPNSVKIGRNPFDSKFEQRNPHPADFADKPPEFTDKPAE
jgi:hypothetical protein